MELALAEQIDLPKDLTDEEQRSLCFKMFNKFWHQASSQGIAFDTVGTMSISATLFALIAKHGPDTTAEFLDDLAKSVRSGEFQLSPKPH
ncbi:hypothetical protein ACFPL7_04615 [Dongia soli]|uniref:Uncharacterized protein n=1 Tax=Dongia soli TaxID=600628 RepID=A0ABU5EI28_9PROT|nr:hypothetical protein [Dongia soli]MDY0885863.1 hypothetical protein [Dongia soli]